MDSVSPANGTGTASSTISSTAGTRMAIQTFFDDRTFTFTHVVHAGQGTACVIIDSVLDFDPRSGRTRTQHADQVIAFVRQQQLVPLYILETHAHADHLSAAPYIREQVGGQIAISEKIRDVQKVFSGIFQFGNGFKADGSDFDVLLADGQQLAVGSLVLKAIAMPGHTPACMAFEMEDVVFVGDTLFMPDVGTARCDFPGGNAHHLYKSIRQLLQRPGHTRLYMCHDYPPAARSPQHVCTVSEQRAANIHIHDGISEEEFVAMRTARDATLDMPVLIVPSIQVNVRAGKLPEPSANGKRYLQIPVDVL